MIFSVRHPMRSNCHSALSFLGITLTTFALLGFTATATESRLADAAEKSDRATIRTLLKQHADVTTLGRNCTTCSMRSVP